MKSQQLDMIMCPQGDPCLFCMGAEKNTLKPVQEGRVSTLSASEPPADAPSLASNQKGVKRWILSIRPTAKGTGVNLETSQKSEEEATVS